MMSRIEIWVSLILIMYLNHIPDYHSHLIGYQNTRKTMVTVTKLLLAVIFLNVVWTLLLLFETMAKRQIILPMSKYLRKYLMYSIPVNCSIKWKL